MNYLNIWIDKILGQHDYDCNSSYFYKSDSLFDKMKWDSKYIPLINPEDYNEDDYFEYNRNTVKNTRRIHVYETLKMLPGIYLDIINIWKYSDFEKWIDVLEDIDNYYAVQFIKLKKYQLSYFHKNLINERMICSIKPEKLIKSINAHCIKICENKEICCVCMENYESLKLQCNHKYC